MASQYPFGPAPPRERRHAELEAEHRHARALVSCLDQPLCAGNRARWLEDALSPLLEAVTRTQRQLQLDQALLRDAPVALHQALRAAAQRGVHLALRGGACLAPGAEALRRAGALLGLPPRWRRWWPQRRSPLPLLVADGRLAFITPTGACAPALALEGPVVPLLQQGFLHDWARRLQPALPARRWQELQPVAGQLRLLPLQPGPPQQGLPGVQALRVALLQALMKAQSRIRLGLGPGETPGPALLRALCQAAWRGVDVQVLLSRPGRTQSLLERAGASARVRPAAAQPPQPGAGARAGVGDGVGAEATALAAALVVVDGLWIALGTPRLCDDPAPVLLDPDVGAEFELHFKRRFDAAARAAAG